MVEDICWLDDISWVRYDRMFSISSLSVFVFKFFCQLLSIPTAKPSITIYLEGNIAWSTLFDNTQEGQSSNICIKTSL